MFVVYNRFMHLNLVILLMFSVCVCDIFRNPNTSGKQLKLYACIINFETETLAENEPYGQIQSLGDLARRPCVSASHGRNNL